jgi:acyl-CoA thioesterase FadM
MSRVTVQLPEHFPFTATIPIRITDLNYGGHVGNDSILTLLHEARMQYLHSIGYTELAFEGVGLIMSDAAIEFKGELFYGEAIFIAVAASVTSKVGFDLVYRIYNSKGTNLVLARTGMICYDYAAKKVRPIPAPALNKLENRNENVE